MVREWTPADLGWAAGVIDGEGCICVYRVKADSSSRAQGLRIVVRVNNTDRRMPDRMRALFGGQVRLARLSPQSRSTMPQVAWQLLGRDVGWFLRLLKPYLVCKQEQAALAIAYVDTMCGGRPGVGGLSMRVHRDRERLRAKLSLIKTELPVEGRP